MRIAKGVKDGNEEEERMGMGKSDRRRVGALCFATASEKASQPVPAVSQPECGAPWWEKRYVPGVGARQ